MHWWQWAVAHWECLVVAAVILVAVLVVRHLVRDRPGEPLQDDDREPLHGCADDEDDERDTLLRLLAVHQANLAEIRQKMQGITYRTITLYGVVMALAVSNPKTTFRLPFALALALVATAAIAYLAKQQTNYIRVHRVVQRIDRRLGCHDVPGFGHDQVALYEPEWAEPHKPRWTAMRAHVIGIVGFCAGAILLTVCAPLFFGSC